MISMYVYMLTMSLHSYRIVFQMITISVIASCDGCRRLI